MKVLGPQGRSAFKAGSACSICANRSPSGMTRTGRDPQGNGGPVKLEPGTDGKLLPKPQEKGKKRQMSSLSLRLGWTSPGHQGLRSGPPGPGPLPHLAAMLLVWQASPCNDLLLVIELPLQDVVARLQLLTQLWLMELVSS